MVLGLLLSCLACENSTRTKVINTRTGTRMNTRMNTRMEVFIVEEKKASTHKSACFDVSRYPRQSYRLCLWREMMR